MEFRYVTYDWKCGGAEDEWKDALKGFGLVMTEDPFQDGSDQYAYFITKGKPTKAQLKKMVRKNLKEFWDMEDDEVEEVMEDIK